MDRQTFAPNSEGLGALKTFRGMLMMEVAHGLWEPLPIQGAAYGSLAALDTLATAYNTTVAQFGEDKVFAEIDAALAAHNQIEQELLSDFVQKSQDRMRRYGSQDSMTMDELDEFGRADAQKITAGTTVGFPLRKYGISTQWTRQYLQNARVDELAKQTVAAMDADSRVIQREIKRAMFNPTNATILDRYVDNISLPIKRLANADGMSIPLGPNGEVFDGSSHTHYLYTDGATLAAADLAAAIETVIEHHPNGAAMVYINRAQEVATRALTGFTAYIDARLIPGGGGTATTAQQTLSSQNVNDRAIGIFSSGGVSAEVWVKPWMLSGYVFVWVRGAPVPLVMRTRLATSGGLELVADDEDHPLRARSWERECGFGVSERTNGALLYIDTGNGNAYVAPTVTA